MSQPPDEFAGRRVTVMGLGRFGGGVGVTRFLVDRGADVLVTDQEPADKLQKSVAQLQDLIDAGRVTLRLGEHNVSDFTTCDLVVVNPAVKPGNRFVRAAEAAGIEVTTEMRLLVQRLPNRLRTIGVTGSAGKSTVTAMIGHVLGKTLASDASRSVWVGGNIGVSLLPEVDQIGSSDWVVLELSSFMLERLRKDDRFDGWSPGHAVVTNISPNHIDWHGSMREYIAAKQVVLEYQRSGDRAFLGGEAAAWNTQEGVDRFLIQGSAGVSKQVLKIPGMHNRVNAAFAAAIGDAIALGHGQQVIQSLSDFPGLPHRLQLVTEHDGVRYFNDSKCTTPEAAMLAIQAFADDSDEKGGEKGDGSRFSAGKKGVGSRFSDTGQERSQSSAQNDSRPLLRGIHLILGGYDKGSDFSSLAALAADTCKAVYTIGKTGDAIAGLCEEARPAEAGRPETCGGVSWPAVNAEIVRCGDLDTAVAEITKRVRPGDVVLLSPACASWDQFENYEHRGERFIELVNQAIKR